MKRWRLEIRGERQDKGIRTYRPLLKAHRRQLEYGNRDSFAEDSVTGIVKLWGRAWVRVVLVFWDRETTEGGERSAV